MSRREKGTRIKNLPPLIQLQNKENISGSLPSVNRTSSDNRTGKYRIFFDDTKSIDFNLQAKISYPFGIQSGSIYISNPELSSSLYASGTVIPSVVDSLLIVNKPGQELAPFNDTRNFATDNKISDAFYSTGSSIVDVGEGFAQPLWSKSKIEVDLSIASSSTFGWRSGSGDDYQMAYYDFGGRTYSPIGSRLRMDEIRASSTGSIDFFTRKAIGFVPAFNGATNNAIVKGVGMPMENFGFPWHPKFLVSNTSSILFPLSGILSEPFLAEKIVLQFSGGYTHGGQALNLQVNTFFILNQKKLDVINKSFENLKSDGTSPSVFVSSSHRSGSIELISVIQISSNTGSVADINPLYVNREFNMSSEFWQGQFTVSGVVKSPAKNDNIYVANYPVSNDTTDFYILKNPNGGRNGQFSGVGRNWLQQVASLENEGYTTIGSPVITIPLPANPWINNPYLLMPTDNLIFGWEVAGTNLPGNPTWWTNGGGATSPNQGPTLTFPVANGKLIIYGSLLRDNQEHHDTLNQLLTSTSINEGVIG